MTADLHLTPRPWKIELQDGTFTLDAATMIRISGDGAQHSVHSARTLRAAIREQFDLELAIVPANIYKLPRIELVALNRNNGSLDPAELNQTDLGPDGYTLRIKPHSVSVYGNTDAGLFYGVQTLIQIARSCGRIWPTLTIRDKPALPNRGFLVDVTRGKVHTPETLETLIRTFAHHK